MSLSRRAGRRYKAPHRRSTQFNLRLAVEALEDRQLMATGVGASPLASAYGGSPAAVPGTIQAEDFDDGGEGVAYHDTTASNDGGADRATGVDLEGTPDDGGGYDVGWIFAGEWLDYTINVPAGGAYTLDARVASPGAGGSFHVEVDGVDETGGLSIPDTGSWQAWQTVRSTVQLDAGVHVMRVAFDTNGASGYVGNLNWLRLTSTLVAKSAPSVSANGPYAAGEGSPISLAANASGGSGTYTYAWDLNNDGTFETPGQNTTLNLPDNGTYTVGVRATDSSGGSAQSTATIVVSNVAPTAQAGGPYTVVAGQTLTLQGGANDPSPIDTAAGLTYTWDFGDSTAEVSGPNLSSPSHTYTAAGNYTVRLTVTDKDGGTTAATTLASIQAPSTPTQVPSLDSTTLDQLPLLTQANLQYVGAFRVPGGTFGDSVFDYGGTAIAFNPANNSLFIVGHDWDQAIAEISIPNSIVNSSQLSDLSTATVLQPFVSVLPKVPNQTLTGNVKIGGLMVVDGQLIGTAYEYYDGDGSAVDSHFKLDSLNLATANVTGLFQVGNLGGGFVGGYMAPVPSEWQAALGAPYLTGQAALSIISRTSYGPAAFGFDPKNLGSSTTPVTSLVYYPGAHPTLGNWDSTDPYFNGTTEIKGVFFAPNSRSVLFFGSHGTNQFGYGEAADFNDPYRTSKGPHSLNGDYAYQVWAYDALDLLAVKNGQKQPWEIKPYAVWNFDFPEFEGGKHIGGVAFDAATGRLYVSQLGGDHVGYSYKPLIQVFQLVNPSLAGNS